MFSMIQTDWIKQRTNQTDTSKNGNTLWTSKQ